ncbi:MAG: hypothetical protein NTZ78_01485 [Candidatus Aureabacteria bacterium]|nr:hypothetical protein [Candidatus Auribacterota bacterium]
MVIDANDNVCIGTVNPVYELHVSGDVKVTGQFKGRASRICHKEL